MKSAGDAPSPDPQIGKAALWQAKTGKQWLNFAKDAFKVSTERQADLDKLTRQVTEQQLGVSQDYAKWAKRDRQRYDKVFKPIEQKFIREAKSAGTKQKQNQAAAEAVADVRESSRIQKGTMRREAMAMGISPNSGRYRGIDREAGLDTALATAGAANAARKGERNRATALRADAANFGRGLPAQSAQATAIGLNAGNSALGGVQGANAQYLASTDIMGNGFRGQMAGYQGQASTLQNLHNSELQAWQSEQQIASQNAMGIGQFAGGLVGLFASDENVKEDKEEIPDGEALDAVNSMPVEEWTYKEGVEDEGRHVGPYAQDFQRATGKGDGRSIKVQDAIGITMKAVQDLDKKVSRVVEAIGLGGGGRAAMGAA